MTSRLRYSLLIAVVGLAVLSGGTPSWASDEDEKRATQLAEKVLAHRRKIESGDFRLDSRVIFYRDGNVVKIENRAEQFREVAEISLSKVEGYGWFPSRVTVTWYEMGGDDLARRDDLDVKVQQINQPVDEATFRIQGIDVPVGTEFIDYRTPQPKMLVVKKKGADPVPRKP